MNDSLQAQLDAIKRRFRDGDRAGAVAACEALRAQHPADPRVGKLAALMHVMLRDFARALAALEQVQPHAAGDADVLFNIALCERELRRFDRARDAFAGFTRQFPAQPDGWLGLAECELELQRPAEALPAAQEAVRRVPDAALAFQLKGRAHAGLGQWKEAADAFTRAIERAPGEALLRTLRAEAQAALGRVDEALGDHRAAVALAPGDDETLKKATGWLADVGRVEDAIALCRQVLQANPDSLTARWGIEWLLSQQVPLWHLPMANERERNQAYFDGLKAAVTPDQRVLEIGTGSGLLALMAASLGAREVVTCEAVPLVAHAAQAVVQRNGYQDRIRVVAKPSYQLEVGADLPGRADLLVHEIFSSELLGEHVLPALEDAKARLLAPGGRVLPAAASIVVALVGGDDLGQELHVGEVFGFDLRPFNAIHARKRPLYREDLPRELLSDPAEAFHFDFQAQSTFPPEKKQLQLRVTRPGRCHGIVQWIRIDFGGGVTFENHPSHRRTVANWQHTVYRFDEPRELQAGAVLTVRAMHDRSRPWFELA